LLTSPTCPAPGAGGTRPLRDPLFQAFPLIGYMGTRKATPPLAPVPGCGTLTGTKHTLISSAFSKPAKKKRSRDTIGPGYAARARTGFPRSGLLPKWVRQQLRPPAARFQTFGAVVASWAPLARVVDEQGEADRVVDRSGQPHQQLARCFLSGREEPRPSFANLTCWGALAEDVAFRHRLTLPR